MRSGMLRQLPINCPSMYILTVGAALLYDLMVNRDWNILILIYTGISHFYLRYARLSIVHVS